MKLGYTIPAGIIDLMRLLQRCGSFSLNELQEHFPLTDVSQQLIVMREVYGAVMLRDNRWQLSYTPQWLCLPPLPLQVNIIDETESTQQLIRACSSPCAIFSEHQICGVGQRARGWLGLPADALALSMLLPAPRAADGLSVALGATLCTVLSDGRLRFKWPNDIVDLSGGKVAGILTEIKGDRLIVGVGVNWRMTTTLARVLGDSGAAPAALADNAPTVPDRSMAAAALVQAIVDTVANYDEGFAPFRAAATAAHIAAAGDALRVDGTAHTFVGFDDSGALLTSAGRHLNAEVQYVAGG